MTDARFHRVMAVMDRGEEHWRSALRNDPALLRAILNPSCVIQRKGFAKSFIVVILVCTRIITLFKKRRDDLDARDAVREPEVITLGMLMIVPRPQS